MPEFAETDTLMVRYVFIDVVAFTRDRSVEAQSDIVRTLNSTVLAALESARIQSHERILIPTGDGICVAITRQHGPIDIHMEIGRLIVEGVAEHNYPCRDEMRRFEVRIGINANIDNFITDINGQPNVAGAGISTAQRVMDQAGPSCIMVGSSVYDVLSKRERYMRGFKRFSAMAKHGEALTVYQYIEEGVAGLSTEIPAAFAPSSRKREPMPENIAAYIAEAVENEDFMPLLAQEPGGEACIIALLWFRAYDRVSIRHATKARAPHFRTERREASFADQFKHYYDQEYWLYTELAGFIVNVLADHDYAFAHHSWIFVSERGLEVLKAEWPDMLQVPNLGREGGNADISQA